MSTTVNIAGYTFLGVSSEIVGYESSRVRAIRYKFKTPAEGANSFSFSKGNIGLYDGTAASLRFCISSSPDYYDTICANLSVGKSVTITNNGGLYTAKGVDNDIILLPNTDYYLYIYPSAKTYCMYTWNYPSNITVMLNGAAGLVRIDTGSGIVTAIPYLDNGTSWKQTIPYLDNGTEFKICG